jgi:predicted nucleic acid-binding protein
LRLPRSLQKEQRSSEDRERLLVVSNSSVIISLAKIRRLDLLEKLFKRIIVPEAVWKEITIEGKPGSEKIMETESIHVEKVGNKRLVALLEEFVDEGGAEAIVLALELNADLLLIDDRDARNLAKKLGLQVMGTLGVIALAKYKGLIPNAELVADRLIEGSFWISRRILEKFLRELGEL